MKEGYISIMVYKPGVLFGKWELKTEKVKVVGESLPNYVVELSDGKLRTILKGELISNVEEEV